MGLFDRFKRQKKETRDETAKKPPLKVASKVQKPEAKKPKPGKKIIKKEFSQAYRILKKPLVTEKSSDLNAFNQYIFKVEPNINKIEIKKAVQDLYGVRVLAVNIIKVPGKTRRMGRHEGWRSGYKKAIVFLAPEEKIEIISR